MRLWALWPHTYIRHELIELSPPLLTVANTLITPPTTLNLSLALWLGLTDQFSSHDRVLLVRRNELANALEFRDVPPLISFDIPWSETDHRSTVWLAEAYRCPQVFRH